MHASDMAATFAPPTKSQLLEKSSSLPKNTSLSASYDFVGHVTHEPPLVSRMSELDVSVNSLLNAHPAHILDF